MIEQSIESTAEIHRQAQSRLAKSLESQPIFSVAKGGLSSVTKEIEAQAKQSRMPEAGENLFRNNGKKPPEPPKDNS